MSVALPSAHTYNDRERDRDTNTGRGSATRTGTETRTEAGTQTQAWGSATHGLCVYKYSGSAKIKNTEMAKIRTQKAIGERPRSTSTATPPSVRLKGSLQSFTGVTPILNAVSSWN